MALNLGYFAVIWGTAYFAYLQPAVFAAILAAHVFTPLSIPCALLGGRAAAFVTSLGIWDWLRREYGVGYAPPGAPGAFDAAAASEEARRQFAKAAAHAAPPREAFERSESLGSDESSLWERPQQAHAHVRTDAHHAAAGEALLPPAPSFGLSRRWSSFAAPSLRSDGSSYLTSEFSGTSDFSLGSDTGAALASPARMAQSVPQPQQQQQQRFIFAYCPQGFLARGALHTFAAAGRLGPMSALPGGVRLAVGSPVLRVPVMQQALLLAGCTDASYGNLKSILQSPQVRMLMSEGPSA
jgi:hypothetical protein